MTAVAIPFLAILLAAEPNPLAGNYFKITVVDEQTGRGVPLVELKTTQQARYYTDSNGVVAFYEPGLMDQTVFFHVKSHGYEFAKDGFGVRGKALKVAERGSAQLKIKRLNIAERLYRVTGGGIYRDSVLLGLPVPTKRPVLNGLVFGQDSVVNTVYRNKIYWFWGDTHKPSYAMGNFNVPGAVSELPANGGLDPEVGVDLDYFVDQKTGFAREMAPMAGPGPTWIGDLVTLRDQSGRERMFAAYVKIKPPMTVYERGLCEFNDDKQAFEKVVQFDLNNPVHAAGHPFKKTDGGVEHIYFPRPFPGVRVKADPEHLKDEGRYECYTCLKEGSRPADKQIDRASDGSIRYSWKRNVPPIGPKEQAQLIRNGVLKSEECLNHFQDVETGKAVQPHGTSVYWNEFRKRWVMITVQIFGSPSNLGEIWYAEADTPAGPWVYARRVVSHEKYSLYNPKQHPMFDKENGRVIFFEGTYTAAFSGNEQTPYYDYNQMMYKLDLAEPRLALPVAIYEIPAEGGPERLGAYHDLPSDCREARIAFFAPDRALPNGVPVSPAGRDGKAGFYVLPAGTKNAPPGTTPLYEFVHEDGIRRTYSTEAARSIPGYRKVSQPVGLVWRTPVGIPISKQ